MKVAKRKNLKVGLKERLAACERLSILSLQLMALVNGYCEGAVGTLDARRASLRIKRELNRIEHFIACWKLQREGRN